MYLGHKWEQLDNRHLNPSIEVRENRNFLLFAFGFSCHCLCVGKATPHSKLGGKESNQKPYTLRLIKQLYFCFKWTILVKIVGHLPV